MRCTNAFLTLSAGTKTLAINATSYNRSCRLWRNSSKSVSKTERGFRESSSAWKCGPHGFLARILDEARGEVHEPKDERLLAR